MKIGQRIYTIYGEITVKGKRYSPIGNKVVWYGVDGYGNEQEIDQSMIVAPPQKEKADGSFKNLAKALDIQKGVKGEPGRTPKAGVDYYSKQQVERIIDAVVKGSITRFTTAEINSVIKRATPIKGKDYFDGDDGYTPISGKDYFTKDQLKKIVGIVVDSVRLKVKDGKDGKRGERGERGKAGKDGKAGRAARGGGGGARVLSGLGDVAVSSPSNSQALVYDSATKKWKNKAQSGGGGGGVDTSGTPADNDFAKFTDADTIEGRSYSEVRTDLNVADGATADGRSQRMGWVFPDSNIDPEEDITGERWHTLSVMWYELNVAGDAVKRDSDSYGTNFYYTAANALIVRQNCTVALVNFSISNAAWMDTLCSSSSNRTDAITELVGFCKDNDFDGVDLDFESYGSWTSSQWANYQIFVRELGEELHSNGLILSVEVPPIWNDSAGSSPPAWAAANSQGYYELTYEAFNDLPVDQLVVMAYDYQYDYSAGEPTQPLEWLRDILQWARSKVNESKIKIVAGMPSAGYSGTTGGYSPTGRTYDWLIQQTGYGEASRDSDSGEVIWADSGISYALCDDTTIQTKVAIAEETGIYFYALWHIGQNQYGGAGLTNLQPNFGIKQTIGIANDNLVEMDDLDAADNDYCKLTANGIEGRSYAELLSDISVTSGADVTADNAPQAHKNSHDPNDGSDALDTAAPAELASVQAAGVGTSHSLARADHAHQIQHSIADNHLVTIDDADAADNDYAKFTASGLEGMSYAEVKSDLSLDNVSNDAQLPLAGGSMTGAIQLGETSIKLDATLSADAKWSGVTTSGVSGVTTLAIGDLIYLNANDSRWELVDANLSDGYDKQLGIALTAAADGVALEVLVFGKVRSAVFPAFTVGSPLYMSETAGDVTHTAPTTADSATRLLGFALTAEDFFFNPSQDCVIHS